MTERYNYIDSNNAHEMRCVHAFGEPKYIGDYTRCSGTACMGWIAEIWDDGRPTGRGRCGMVQEIMRSNVPDSAQKHEPVKPWEPKKGELVSVSDDGLNWEPCIFIKFVEKASRYSASRLAEGDRRAFFWKFCAPIRDHFTIPEE